MEQWKTLDSNDQNQAADQRFSLQQWFVGGAQSRGLRKSGCGHCYLRFSWKVTAAMLVAQLILWELNSIITQTFSFVSEERQGY